MKVMQTGKYKYLTHSTRYKWCTKFSDVTEGYKDNKVIWLFVSLSLSQVQALSQSLHVSRQCLHGHWERKPVN